MTEGSPVLRRGLIVYDVPSDHPKMAYRLRNALALSGTALRVNLSAYLFPWGRKHEIDAAVKEVMDTTAGSAHVCSILQDEASGEELDAMVYRAANEMLAELRESVVVRVAAVEALVEKAIDDGTVDVNDKDRTIYRRRQIIVNDVARRAKALKSACIIFTLTGNVMSAIEALEEAVNVESAALKAMKDAGVLEKAVETAK